MSVGYDLRSARLRAHLSQAELAARLGVSTRTLQAWESGRARPWPRNARVVDDFIREVEGRAA